jgi:hypothetical protein
MNVGCSLRNWGWLCPFLMVGLAAGILALFGLSWWTALLVAILLVCPAIMVWGAIQIKRKDGR